MKALTISALLLAAVTLSTAVEKRIELPPEKATFKPGKGSELAMGQCFTCHSVEYIATQPAMPRKFWEATVIKMRDKFGAPIPEATMPQLIDYLTDTYGKKSS